MTRKEFRRLYMRRYRELNRARIRERNAGYRRRDGEKKREYFIPKRLLLRLHQIVSNSRYGGNSLYE